MEGHKRREGTMLCPSVSSISGSLPSPPDSPTSSTRSLPVGPFHPAVLPEIIIPNEGGVYRRPNPNWVDHIPAPPLPSSSDAHEFDESEQSVVSTVLLDDGSSIKTSDEDDEPTTDDENDSVIGSALGTSLPLASIFSTPKEDIAGLRKAATDIGLYFGLMRRPGARDDGKSTVNRLGERENSWWVVMGRNAEAVRHLVNVQQRAMPGFYEPDKETQVEVGRPASSMGFLQVVLAGAIGGATVLFGMAKLL